MVSPTPGPWKSPRYAPWMVVAEDALPGDRCLAETHEDRRVGRTKEEAHANARLMAAAPDLLEALVECESALSLLHHRAADALPRHEVDHRIGRARRAIDAAGGWST